MTDFPRVGVLSATPLRGSWATSSLMSQLFEGWPPSQLCQVTVARDGVDLATQGVETHLVRATRPKDALGFAREFRDARSFLADQRIDVLYFRSAGWPVVIEALGAKLVRERPTVLHIMDDWPASRRHLGALRHRPLDVLLRSSLRRSNVRFAISQSMADAFEKRYRAEFGVVHAGARTGCEPVATTGAQNTVLYSGSVSTEQSEQSLIDVAQSIERLREQAAEVVFEVAPSTPPSAEFQRTLKSAGATILEQTSYEGYLQRLASARIVLAAANFDATSRAFLRYSMPQKVPELLQCGTPVLAYGPSDISWIASADAHGWALVVGRRDPVELDRALRELFFDDDLRAEHVARARTVAGEMRSVDEMRARLHAALISLKTAA